MRVGFSSARIGFSSACVKYFNLVAKFCETQYDTREKIKGERGYRRCWALDRCKNNRFERALKRKGYGMLFSIYEVSSIIRKRWGKGMQ